MTDPSTIIHAEIAALEDARTAKLAELQTLDGALQAFRYLLDMVAKTDAPAVTQ